MIDEPDLRELFAAESSDLLERLERGLLALEKAPGERSLLETVFRQAHSLKGSAASLGLHQVESVAHRFEDALDDARHGRSPLSSERLDQLYRALDALRSLVDESVTGRPSGVDLKLTLANLQAVPSQTLQPVEPLAQVREPEVAPLEKDPKAVVRVQENPEATAAQSSETVTENVPSTVRVETVRLDRALAGTGDLVVTSGRLALRRAEASRLRDLYELWARNWRLQGEISSRESEKIKKFGSDLEQLIQALADDQTRLEYVTDNLREEIQEMRLVPLSGLFQRFQRIVRDLARQEGKEIELVIEGGETTADRRLLEHLVSPLTHLVRNAVDHGVESPKARLASGKPRTATLYLRAERRGPMLEITLRDDGAGVNLQAVAQRAKELRIRTEEQLLQASDAELSLLVFAPGFSTRKVVSELSGRGTGLDAVRAEIEGVGGTVGVESQSGQGSQFRLRIPLTLSISQVMVCSCGERLFAVPLVFVERSLFFDSSQIFWVEGRACLEVEGALVPVSHLDSMLGGSSLGGQTCLVISDRSERHGFLVEELLGVMEIVVKPFYESALVGGASTLPDGRVCLVLQSSALLRLANSSVSEVRTPRQKDRFESQSQGRLLVAEDSPTIAALAERVLREAGYEVCLVGDGLSAWRMACEQSFDAVVSDIEMPGINGLELTRRLRGLASYNDVPIVLVTALGDEESKLAGLDAGASAYLGKSSLEEGTLVRLLGRLL